VGAKERLQGEQVTAQLDRLVVVESRTDQLVVRFHLPRDLAYLVMLEGHELRGPLRPCPAVDLRVEFGVFPSGVGLEDAFDPVDDVEDG